jgi:hydrogenase maturation protease
MQEVRYLVIGYGNTLRSDDAAGQHIAETVAEWHLPQVQALAVHQLTPELAEPLSVAHGAIFVDAYPATDDAPQVQIIELTPANSLEFGTLGHTADPRSLLALTQRVYGTAPPGWWVLVPAVNFEFGEQLSPVTQHGITDALEQIKQLVSYP